MYRQQTQRRLDFATNFIHAVTVRPFFEDLRRMRLVSTRCGEIPSANQAPDSTRAA